MPTEEDWPVEQTSWLWDAHIAKCMHPAPLTVEGQDTPPHTAPLTVEGQDTPPPTAPLTVEGQDTPPPTLPL